MAAETVAGEILVCRARYAVLDAAGATPAGSTNSIITDQVVSVKITPVIEDGEEISQKTGCGEYAWAPFKQKDYWKWLTVEVTHAMTDYEFESIAVGHSLLTASSTTIGGAYPALGRRPAADYGISAEFWSYNLDSSGFQDASLPWVWRALPRLTNGRVGEKTLQNGAVVPTYTFIARENPGWGNGPSNDWTPASTRVCQSIKSAAAPPAAVVGFTPTPAQV